MMTLSLDYGDTVDGFVDILEDARDNTPSFSHGWGSTPVVVYFLCYLSWYLFSLPFVINGVVTTSVGKTLRSQTTSNRAGYSRPLKMSCQGPLLQLLKLTLTVVHVGGGSHAWAEGGTGVINVVLSALLVGITRLSDIKT